MSVLAVTDPYYQHSGPARLVRKIISGLGLDLIVDDYLDHVAANARTGTIGLPAGLPWRTAHELIDRSFLFITGGVDWAEEFQPPSRPMLRLVSQGDTAVAPIVHRPW